MSENTPPPAGGTNLTPLGKLLTFVLIAGFLGVGGYLVYKKAAVPGDNGAGNGVAMPTKPPVEVTGNAQSVTTVTKYNYVAPDKLPAVKGTSNYKWDNDKKVLRFSYNVWAGWLPVIAANHGTEPNDESIFYKKYGFRVQMVLMDDPVMARDAFAAGDVHTVWGTVDMMVLFAPTLAQDSRTSPRIVQQIDWSSGGDGIVVRSNIKNVADLKGKTIALAPNSPSEYFLTSLLLSAGINPSDVTVKHTATAFEAAAAFVADSHIDGCVSWSPDIYNIPKGVANTRILSSSAEADKLIADVYALRPTSAATIPTWSRAWWPASSRAWTWSRRTPIPPASGSPTPSRCPRTT